MKSFSHSLKSFVSTKAYFGPKWRKGLWVMSRKNDNEESAICQQETLLISKSTIIWVACRDSKKAAGLNNNRQKNFYQAFAFSFIMQKH